MAKSELERRLRDASLRLSRAEEEVADLSALLADGMYEEDDKSCRTTSQ